MKAKITPHKLCGNLVMPQSKSYAHRRIIAAALSAAKVFVAPCDDALATLNGLAAMGFCYKKKADEYDFGGSNAVKLHQQCVIDCNESGSTLRFLLPLAAALGVNAEFVGKGRLFLRPLEGLTDCLNTHGTVVHGNCVCGRLQGGEFAVDATVSSQFVSGLLMALPLVGQDSTLTLLGEPVSKPYIDVTLDVLSQSGIEVAKTKSGYFIRGNQRYAAPYCAVQGDWSAAAFWLTAAALGGKISLNGLLQDKQGDAAIVDILRLAGATVLFEGNVEAKCNGSLKGFTVNLEHTPDLAPIVAVAAAFAKEKSVLTGLGRLANKESNRLCAICKMLATAGVTAKCSDSTIEVIPSPVHGGDFDGAKDHRMVMAAAVLAAFAEGNSTVSDMQCVSKSYPAFWQDFARLGGCYEVEG